MGNKTKNLILSLIILCLFSGGAWTATTVLAAAHGGTGQSSYTAGDLLFSTGVLTLSKLGIGSNDTVLTIDSTQSTKSKWAILPTPGGHAIYGNGHDGAINLNGTNTFSGIYSKSGSVYTQLRDVVGTSITVANGVTVKTGNYRTFANVSVTLNGTGTLCNSGANGNVVNPTATPSPGIYASGGIGGIGGGPICSGGNAGYPAPDICYSLGGNGGAGTCGPCGGGSGGTANALVARAGGQIIARTIWAITGFVSDGGAVRASGGAGGGGGGANCCSGPVCSGSGGNGGGIITVVSPYILGTGTIKATGGDAGFIGIGAYSGGGGGGGAIVLGSDNPVCPGITLKVCGGVHAPGCCGAISGSPGHIFQVLNK